MTVTIPSKKLDGLSARLGGPMDQTSPTRTAIARPCCGVHEVAAIILPLGHDLMGEPWGSMSTWRNSCFLSVGAGDNRGGLQHVRLQLAQC
jgi:hypothetical protein